MEPTVVTGEELLNKNGGTITLKKGIDRFVNRFYTALVFSDVTYELRPDPDRELKGNDATLEDDYLYVSNERYQKLIVPGWTKEVFKELSISLY